MKKRGVFFGFALLAILLFSLLIIAQPETIEGQLEVTEYLSPDNPQNSGYLFYLNSAGKRYKLESDRPLPVLESGTFVKIRGVIQDNIIFVDSSDEDPFDALPGEANEEKERAADGAFESEISWLYFSLPILIIIVGLIAVEVKRKKGHASLQKEKRQHFNATLRNYVVTTLKKGFRKDQIRNALLRYNYSEAEIDEAFSGL